MSGNRLQKVNSLLEHEISKILVRDFNFSGTLVTLTRVDTSPNLIQAKVHVSVMPNDQTDHVVDVLNKGVYDVQQKINKTLNMRPIPKLLFKPDKEVGNALRVEELLEKIKESDTTG